VGDTRGTCVMPVIYIAGPYRATTAWLRELNVRAAEEAALLAAQHGCVPVCPHTMTRFFDGTLTDAYWLEATLEIMRRCDAVLFVAGWKGSKGSLAEKAEAERLGMPVAFYSGWKDPDDMPVVIAELKRKLAVLREVPRAP